MKNLILFLSCFGMLFSLSAQIVNFPDENFKSACVSLPIVDTNGDGIPDSDVDTNNDGEIQVSEAEAVINFYPRGAAIFSLEGIEAFSNVVRLNCSQNNLTALDLSQNTNLEVLSCFFNDLTVLDVSFLSELKELNADLNELNTLDVTQNSLLERLFVPINELSFVDVSQNPNLKMLNVDANLLTEIDLSQNPQLEFVSFDSNEISEIDFSQNLELSVVDVFDNNLTSLDLSQNPNLTKLWCYDNQLEFLSIKNGANTDIVILNAQDNPELNCIEVDDVTYAYNQAAWLKDDTSAYSKDCLLGIADERISNFVLYPNPVNDVLYFETSEALQKITVFNAQGRRLLSTQESINSVDLSSFPNGILFFQLEADGIFIIKKIVKE